MELKVISVGPDGAGNRVVLREDKANNPTTIEMSGLTGRAAAQFQPGSTMRATFEVVAQAPGTEAQGTPGAGAPEGDAGTNATGP